MVNRGTDRTTDMSGNQDKRITVYGRETTVIIGCLERESLLEAMTRQGIYISAACGGRGTCGKCKIKQLAGNLEITSSDRRVFTEQELNAGYRLSCKAYPSGDVSIQIIEAEENDFEVVAEGQSNVEFINQSDKGYGIAIDIGTTTLAISLISLSTGDILNTYTTVNQQRAYGADVISRIQLSNHGKQKELQECIRQDLLTGIRTIMKNTGMNKEGIKKIAIAGNTTMGHLLLGYSCNTLGTYPFTPINIEETVLSFEEVFGTDELDASVVILPGISTFVGGDITAGLLVCDFDRSEKINLFIDLGTNGEMAIGNKHTLLVSSTAAGPAFEGGNISCGVGSIAGAISSVELVDGILRIHTIGDKTPVGICGTGVVELTSELYKSGLIDETGLLSSEYFDHGFKVAESESRNAITFTQRDIRELQLAKAAIRAGVEILIRRYGIGYDDIDTIYVAGGFGYKMNITKAIHIGLLPEGFAGNIKAIGNSSLSGAVRYLMDDQASHRLKNMIDVSREIHLSNDMDFNDLYIKYMDFSVE